MDTSSPEPPGGGTRVQARPPSVWSKDPPLMFREDDAHQRIQTGPPSVQTDHSKDSPPTFREDHFHVNMHQTPKELEDEPITLNPQMLVCQMQMKSQLRHRYSQVFEGVTTAGSPAPLQQIYTELDITEGGASVCQEHEVRHVQTGFWTEDQAVTVVTCEDMFKGPAARNAIRTVLTVGVAGVGKTALTQKFSLDWAEGHAHQNVQMMFLFTFRELNSLQNRCYSLVELVQHFSEIQAVNNFMDLQLLFILDGLDESRLSLDFVGTRVLSDPTESASVEELLVNLIKGSLLPSARVWITTRPAAANQIPPECVSMVTEVQGFNDLQKEQYFRKRFLVKDQADKIISHIKRSRILDSMCYNPMFCWILSTVLDHMMKESPTEDLPHTLTLLYIHFLVLQVKTKSVKYEGRSEMDSPWTPDTRKMVDILEKLAFENLQEGNLIFYESDMSLCGLNAEDAAVYSGVFTQVFKEEPGQALEKVYSFIHLTVQEFLAALHIHQNFFSSGQNLLVPSKSSKNLETFYQSAVDQALKSPYGQLDLILRFLLGLSLPTNHSLLQGLLMHLLKKSPGPQTVQQTVQYIERKITKDLPAERIVTLFYCLYELNDRSLVEKIQRNIREQTLRPEDMSNALWSALAFLLLSSDLEEFILQKYRPSEEILLKLMKVVEASTKALLSDCNLTKMCCGPLSIVLSSDSSALKVLDISHNLIEDSGVELLCEGLKSATCRLETIKMEDCDISDRGVMSLDSALKSGSPLLMKIDLTHNYKITKDTPQLRSLQSQVTTLSVGFPLEDRREHYRRLTLDGNTAHINLALSQNRRAVKHTGFVPFLFSPWNTSDPQRFDSNYQVLCSEPLTGRCFWVVQWEGFVDIALSYNRIQRKGTTADCEFGGNAESWSLRIKSSVSHSVWHNNRSLDLSFFFLERFFSVLRSGKVAVFLDHDVGRLSFFHVSDNDLIHIHTFRAKFTEPLYAGFGLRWTALGSSVKLVDA